MPLTISPTVLRTIGGMFGKLGGAVGATAGAGGVRGAIAAGARGAVRQLPGAIVGGAAMGAGSAMVMRGGGQAFGRRRRGRGITAAELRGARKVASLVRMYGMKPKSGKIGGRRRCR